MAGPQVLCENAEKAIEDGDWKAFQRWSNHPRWNPTHSEIGKVVNACFNVNAAETLIWLKRLEFAGIAMTQNHHDGVSVMGRATLALKTDVVDWLLSKDVSLPWSWGMSPLHLVLDGLKTLASSSPNHAPLYQQSAAHIAVAFFHHKNQTFSNLVGLNRDGLIEVGGQPLARPVFLALMKEGWDPQLPEKEWGQSFLEVIQQSGSVNAEALLGLLDWARLKQRAKELDGVLPEPNSSLGFRPRF